MVWPTLSTLLTLLAVPYLATTTCEAAAWAYLRALGAHAHAHAHGGGGLETLLLPLLPRWGPGRVRAAQVALRRHAVLRAVARLKRGGYLAFVVLQLLLAGARWLGRAARRLHDALRDERYLVGVELQNREPGPAPPSPVRGEGVVGGGE